MGDAIPNFYLTALQPLNHTYQKTIQFTHQSVDGSMMCLLS